MESSVFSNFQGGINVACQRSHTSVICLCPLPVFVLCTDRLPTTMYCYAVVSVYPLWVSEDDES